MSRSASALSTPCEQATYNPRAADTDPWITWERVRGKLMRLRECVELRPASATDLPLLHRYYQAHFPEAQFCVIECAGQDVGRWYLDRTGTELRLIDIALLPQWRRQGIGSQLLNALLAEADVDGRDILLHVEANNPALGM